MYFKVSTAASRRQKPKHKPTKSMEPMTTITLRLDTVTALARKAFVPLIACDVQRKLLASGVAPDSVDKATFDQQIDEELHRYQGLLMHVGRSAWIADEGDDDTLGFVRALDAFLAEGNGRCECCGEAAFL